MSSIIREMKKRSKAQTNPAIEEIARLNIGLNGHELNGVQTRATGWTWSSTLPEMTRRLNEGIPFTMEQAMTLFLDVLAGEESK